MNCQALRTAPAIAALALLAAGASAHSCIESQASVEGGNVIVLLPTGARVKITDSAADSQPDLSCDGTKVVFVRTFGPERSEIWVANTSEPYQPQPLVASPIIISGRKFTQAFAPEFSPGGDNIYFLIPFAATTQAIIATSLRNHEPRLVAAALNFRVVPTGKYTGDLVAQIRKAKLAPGYYQWFWLLSPDGKEIGVIGQSERDVDLFLDQQRDGPR